METIGTSRRSTVIDTSNICDALHNFVPFAQFKKCEKNPTKSNTPPWVFFTLLKLNKWYQITQSIKYGTHKNCKYKHISNNYYRNIIKSRVNKLLKETYHV